MDYLEAKGIECNLSPGSLSAYASEVQVAELKKLCMEHKAHLQGGKSADAEAAAFQHGSYEAIQQMVSLTNKAELSLEAQQWPLALLLLWPYLPKLRGSSTCYSAKINQSGLNWSMVKRPLMLKLTVLRVTVLTSSHILCTRIGSTWQEPSVNFKKLLVLVVG